MSFAKNTKDSMSDIDLALSRLETNDNGSNIFAYFNDKKYVFPKPVRLTLSSF